MNSVVSVFRLIRGSVNHHKRLGACLATGACSLAASLPANALTFNWSWDLNLGSPSSSGTVQGTISGLVDDQANQISGVVVEVLSAPNTPPGGWSGPWVFEAGSGLGFAVLGGFVTVYDGKFTNSSLDDLFFGNCSNWCPQLANSDESLNNGSNPGSITFFNVPEPDPVPGPLPLLGAGAAFGWSRRIRRRLKVSTDDS